jgi:hypothetical protein
LYSTFQHKSRRSLHIETKREESEEEEIDDEEVKGPA